MTALVSLSVGGAVTGFSFVPKAAADITSPTSMPLNLVALRQAVQAPQSAQAPSQDAMMRAAIVHVADYYLRMAQTKSPAQMEAIIWQRDSVDGADHGQSCAAFASLTLELGAQVVGGQSWVSGGGSYPWPLHTWADVRVEPNPDSLGIISIQQDAEANHRWHPLGDGYQPLPGDWVLFNGHVEVVTKDAGGVLHTVGGDSLPNFSVNAHEYPQPLSAAGVVGFVNNGSLSGAAQASADQPSADQASAAQPGGTGTSARAPGAPHHNSQPDVTAASGALADIPGTAPASSGSAASEPSATGAAASGQASAARAAGGPAATAPSAPTADGGADPAIPGLVPAPRSGSAAPAAGSGPAPATAAPGREAAAAKQASAGKQAQAGKEGTVAPGGAAIPGLAVAADLVPHKTGSAYRRHHPSPVPRTRSETRSQQAFIDEVAPGAIEAQHTYGVPAAVTIAQAIDESGWGQSQLAAQDHNLFGIKGTGPAGSVPLPTQEYVNGQPVNTSASFRVYHDAAESIADHGRLLAQSGYYQQAMAVRHNADKFAAALTGVYATDPNYGSNLISLMRRYDLYQYGATGPGQTTQRAPAAEPGSATIPGVGGAPSARPEPTGPAAPSAASHHPTREHTPEPASTATPDPSRTATPQPTGSPSPQPTRTATPQPTGTSTPQPTGTGSPQPTGTASPQPTGTSSPQPARRASPQPTRTTTPGSGPTQSPRPTASPQPAAASSPQPSATDSPSATPAVPPSPARSGPAAPPSVSPGQPDIPGVATESEAENAMTSAVRFGPASAFVPVAEPEADSTLMSAVRFGRRHPSSPWPSPRRLGPRRPTRRRPSPRRPSPHGPTPRQPSPPRPGPRQPGPPPLVLRMGCVPYPPPARSRQPGRDRRRSGRRWSAPGVTSGTFPARY